jgi:TPR repeat protein
MLSVSVAELRDLALQSNDVRAACLVSQWYLEGANGAPQSTTAAIDLLLPWAEAGCVNAQVALARIGDGIGNIDLGGAYKWTRAAAEQGHLPSVSRLIGKLLTGEGCEPDPDEATRWKVREQVILARRKSVIGTARWMSKISEFETRLERPFRTTSDAFFAYSAKAYEEELGDR